MLSYLATGGKKENMKTTGMVRRIDDLGRVVIPKEIRQAMRIKEGDPLEIFADRNNGVVLKKYNPDSVQDDIDRCLEALEEHASEIGVDKLGVARRALKDIRKQLD